MPRISATGLALLVSFAAGLSPVRADWRFWRSDCVEEAPAGSRQRFHSGKAWPPDARPTGRCQPYMQQYHTQHYWPDPYRWQDRSAVRAQLDSQANAGWITATTLYDQHFDPETQALNGAGRLHLRWILLHAPPSRRMVWVQSGDLAAVSEVRLVSAQQEATAIAGAECAPVMLRVCLPQATPAQEIDLIRRAWLATTPQPRLPFTSASGGGAGAAAASPTPQASPSSGQ